MTRDQLRSKVLALRPTREEAQRCCDIFARALAEAKERGADAGDMFDLEFGYENARARLAQIKEETR